MAQTTEKVIRTAQTAGLSPRSDVAALVALMNKLTMRHRVRSTNAAGAVIGSSAPAKVKLANTVNFLIAGLWVALTTAEYVVPSGAAMAATAGDKEVWLCLSSVDGVTVVVTVGTVALLGAAATKPTVPDDAALICFVKIAAAASNIFTPGTTSLAGAGITTTYQDAAFDDREVLKLDPTQ